MGNSWNSPGEWMENGWRDQFVGDTMKIYENIIYHSNVDQNAARVFTLDYDDYGRASLC